MTVDGLGLPADGSGKEGRWLEKSIRVGQGTETSSVGLSQLKDQVNQIKINIFLENKKCICETIGRVAVTSKAS